MYFVGYGLFKLSKTIMDWRSMFCEDRIRRSKSMGARQKGDDPRTEFDSDFGRVVFSAAARRLHDKTQVIPLTTNDNIHSRLTHSMEVMNVGESIVKFIFADSRIKGILGADCSDYESKMSAMVKTTCLMHDIGNPPFGHFGEQAISSFFKDRIKELESKGIKDSELLDFIEFDGNAQGFRVLTKLQCLEDLHGLNLTKGTLAAYLKYPNCGKGVKDVKDKKGNIIEKKYLSQHKHGVFSVDWDYAEEALTATKCGQIGADKCYFRHPASYIMEAADSICYLSMDIEDAYNKGWIKVSDIWTYLFERGCSEKIVMALFNIKKDGSYSGKDFRKKYFDDGRGHRLIVEFRVHLIGTLIKLAAKNFVDNYHAILEGKFKDELIDKDDNHVAQYLKDFCVSKIYSQKEIMSLEVTGYSVIRGLIGILIDLINSDEKGVRNRGKALISRSILRANVLDFYVRSKKWSYDKTNDCYLEEGKKVDVIDAVQQFNIDGFSEYFKYRVIVDFVSGMTDKYAVSLYQKLSGWAL